MPQRHREYHILTFGWLKRILSIGKLGGKVPGNKKSGVIELSYDYDGLEEREKTVLEEKKQQKVSSTEWYVLAVPKRLGRKPVELYHAYHFIGVLNLKSLKEERLKKEALELKMLEDEVSRMLTSIEKFIDGRRAEEAKNTLDKILDKIVKVKDTSIRQKYQALQNRHSRLVSELEREELARLAEERRRKEEEEHKKREAEELARKERERREEDERKRKEIEAIRLAETARKKAEAEQEERNRLERLSSELKDNWQDFKQILDENGVSYLYHFTDSRNIPSIKIHGGLFSWYYCQKHGITIPCQGGDYDSRELDKKYGLEDYVRLSFCNDHPMAYRLKLSGSDIIILRIKADVALLKDTQFSDMNAADKRHTHGKSLKHLQMVNFCATRMHYLRNEDPNFKPHQAEVMVKTFIPLKYIENI